MSRRTPHGKRTRELLRQLPEGVSIERQGRGGHLVVLLDGVPVRDEKGLPLLLAGTTSGPLAVDLTRIRRALAAPRGVS